MKKPDKDEVIITDHAYRRGKERLGLSKKSIEKMALISFTTGRTADKLPKQLRQYLVKLQMRHDKNAIIRIYGNHIFVFVNNILLTIFLLPNDYKKYLK